jgi:hypothetical protein
MLTGGHLYEVLSLFWLSTICFGFVVTSSMLILGVIFLSDEGDDQIINLALIVAEGFASFTIPFTLVLKSQIIKFFLLISGASDDSNSSIDGSIESIQRSSGRADEKSQRVLLPPQPLSIPIFLVNTTLCFSI